MPAESHTILSATGLSVTVPGRTLVDDFELELRQGELVAVLGRNGTGKTLTLHTLAGLREPDAGEISVEGMPLGHIPRQQLARQMALLPQHSDDVFPASVLDTALIGRHPHIERFRWESAADVSVARQALSLMNLEALADRDVLSLSGGERRRLAISQIVAQDPQVYLLDEPTNHLDPQHQLDAVSLFRRKADEGCSVFASLHDVNLASRFADRCVLLYGDGRWETGACEEVLTAQKLSELYGTPMQAVEWQSRSLFFASGQST